MQLIDMLATLLERPVIHECFHHKYSVLIEMCNDELDVVKVLFDKQLALMTNSRGPIINKNMPPVSGLLCWSQELHDRIELIISKLMMLNTGTGYAMLLIIHLLLNTTMHLFDHYFYIFAT